MNRELPSLANLSIDRQRYDGPMDSLLGIATVVLLVGFGAAAEVRADTGIKQTGAVDQANVQVSNDVLPPKGALRTRTPAGTPRIAAR